MSGFGKALRDFMRDLRDERRTERQSRPPARLMTMPSCRACGTAVPAGVRFCDAPSCQERARRTAPKATIETGPQPQTPQGVNFGYVDTDKGA